jgi:hypothetical protein
VLLPHRAYERGSVLVERECIKAWRVDLSSRLEFRLGVHVLCKKVSYRLEVRDWDQISNRSRCTTIFTWRAAVALSRLPTHRSEGFSKRGPAENKASGFTFALQIHRPVDPACVLCADGSFRGVPKFWHRSGCLYAQKGWTSPRNRVYCFPFSPVQIVQVALIEKTETAVVEVGLLSLKFPNSRGLRRSRACQSWWQKVYVRACVQP